ncbi:MAG: 2,3-bisphosphoglycerate-independent phosphoglycerate mutase [Clostridia bacterium]
MIALIILDGYGLSERREGNAVLAAHTPNLDRYFRIYPHTTLSASGLSVGLPEGQMGNSEVGHTNIGAGRVVYQELTRISKSIKDGDFFENPELLEAFSNCRENQCSLHVMGLLSDGGVHSHNTHLYALLDMAKANGMKQVYIHCFFDGRDVPPDSAICYVRELEEIIRVKGIGKIASIMGRYYGMDRDTMWDRVKLAYDAMVLGTGAEASSAEEGVLRSYDAGVMDEFVIPCVIRENNGPVKLIEPGDSIVFFNFRPDRARAITKAFIEEDFKGFPREKGYFPVNFISFTQYDVTYQNIRVAFKPSDLTQTFGEHVSKKGLRQLRIAETTKYAHVTFFFNGGVEAVFDNEDRVLIDTPKVATFDMQPEMSAPEVAEAAIRRIQSGKYEVMVLNFANCDMVGHTGNFPAAVKAVEAVDQSLGKVVDSILHMEGIAVITADHGNAEQMLDEDGRVFTAHTLNPVPFIIAGYGDLNLREGILADIAPTLLDLLNLEKPEKMTGKSLILK